MKTIKEFLSIGLVTGSVLLIVVGIVGVILSDKLDSRSPERDNSNRME